MFKKTRLHLVLWNALIFFLVLLAFGIAMYFYMDRVLLRGTDQKLLGIAEQMNKEGFKGIRGEHEHEREIDRGKVAYLFWKKNKYVGMFPERALYTSDLDDLAPGGKEPETRTVDGETYRTLTVSAPSGIKGDFDDDTDDRADKVMLVLNIDAETNALNELLRLILSGIAVSLAVSLTIGSFLAWLSLKPIQKSWEKQAQFAQDASHELRTPLAVLQTQLELLFRKPGHTIEEESEGIYKSLNEVKRMNKLVGDLLTLSRADSNERLIEKKSFDIGELVSFVAEQFQPIAELKEITLKCTAEPLHFTGDKDRLHQLLLILLDNAVKYTGEKGQVAISCKKEAHAVQIEVKDSGIGIPEGDLPKIFDRFYRSDKSRTRKEGGTGLGLSIAEWIVKAHKGDIKAVSTVGKGTAFIVRLPIGKQSSTL